MVFGAKEEEGKGRVGRDSVTRCAEHWSCDYSIHNREALGWWVHSAVGVIG